MAINVNTVYQTVLLILNKEQRGYMTPVEFNKTGAQAQLEIFDEEIELRKQAGTYYNHLIETILLDYGVSPLNTVPEYCTKYNWQNFHLLLDDRYNRDQVIDLLRKRNIGCKWDIQAIHKEPAYNQDHHDNNLPQTLKYHNQGLWLGFYAEITKEDQEYVISQLKEVLDEIK